MIEETEITDESDLEIDAELWQQVQIWTLEAERAEAAADAAEQIAENELVSSLLASLNDDGATVEFIN